MIINYYAPDKENDQLPVLNEINQTKNELYVEQNIQIIRGRDFNGSFDLQLDTDGRNPSLRLSESQKL